MNTIFIGGSRDVTKLPAELINRLDAIITQRHRVLVGDANGADKQVQKYLASKNYPDVILYCSGEKPRNNVGEWTVHPVVVQAKAKDYHFYAMKDREMAEAADFGLMIWDGKSPGTLLNLVRLIERGKIAVLYHLPEKHVLNFKSAQQLRTYLSHCSDTVRSDIIKRATPEEKRFLEGEDVQPSLLDQAEHSSPPPMVLDAQMIAALNGAFDAGDAARVIEALNSLARENGMSRVAREAGVAREGLYRSLDAKGNPEFATVMKLLSALGIKLSAHPRTADTPEDG